MTASDIINICVTVAVVQAVCDLLAYFRVYRTEAYERALEKRARAKFRKDKARRELDHAREKTEGGGGGGGEDAGTTTTAGKRPGGKAVRLAKTAARAEQDFDDATAHVARFGLTPGVLTSVMFVILMRVLGTEHQGELMGVLPFVPFRFVHRMTGRGLDFGSTVLETTDDGADDVRHVMQGFSFVLVYFLAGLSVKFYVSRILGNRPPGTCCAALVCVCYRVIGNSGFHCLEKRLLTLYLLCSGFLFFSLTGGDTIFSLAQSTWGKKWLESYGKSSIGSQRVKTEVLWYHHNLNRCCCCSSVLISRCGSERTQNGLKK